jgi:hypothetical protein
MYAIIAARMGKFPKRCRRAPKRPIRELRPILAAEISTV